MKIEAAKQEGITFNKYTHGLRKYIYDIFIFNLQKQKPVHTRERPNHHFNPSKWCNSIHIYQDGKQRPGQF